MPMEIIPGPNLIVATPPAGDSSHKPADTEFVTLGLAALSTAIGTAIASAIAGIPAATPPCFSVNKNGTDQTGVTNNVITPVTWSTEVYDVGNFFASNVWVPPAGKVSMTFVYVASGTLTVGAGSGPVITKNGATAGFKSTFFIAGSGATGGNITIEDAANGTDAYGAAVVVPLTAGTATILGTISQTFFMGHWISV